MRLVPVASQVLSEDHSGMRVAAIDVGSHGVKVSVAAVCAGGGLEVLDRDRVTIQIAAHLERDGTIGDDAIRRVAATVANHCARAKALAADRIAIVGTAAAREAADRASLQGAVLAASGYELTLVSGAQEATLTWEAIQGRFGPRDGAVVIDVGGGSTEFVFAARGAAAEVASVPLGAVRLSSHMAAAEQWTPRTRADLSMHIRSEFHRCVPHAPSASHATYVTGGTASLLAIMAVGGLPVQPRSGVMAELAEGIELDVVMVDDMVDRLAGWGLSDRVEQTGLTLARARVLPVGCLILREALAWIQRSDFIVSDLGIRDGMMLRLADGRPIC